MEQLTRLKARIESLGELRELMRAMRALAASHVQAAQTALEGIRRYMGVIEVAIAEGMTLLPDNAPTAPTHQPTRDLLIMVGSEHGFVGGFNERLMEHAVESLGPDRQLAVIGQRAVDLATEYELIPIWTHAMATQVSGVLGTARSIASHMGGVQQAEVIYAAYRRGGNYEVEQRRILPLDPQLLQRARVRSPPLHHLPAELLLLRLADEYLMAELTRALMESFASENGARLRVMESGDRNIDDKLQDLGARAHTLRQGAITAELLDLMTAAEASVNFRK